MITAKFIYPREAIQVRAHRDGKEFLQQYTAIDRETLIERVTLRIYRSKTGASYYACVWVNAPGQYASGSGIATGYGYDKASGAADNAISAAGIWLNRSIHGCGEAAIYDAVRALAELAGAPGAIIHVAHR